MTDQEAEAEDSRLAPYNTYDYTQDISILNHATTSCVLKAARMAKELVKS